MTLNLDKNKAVLVHGWKEVLDQRNPINWALFGYDGQTYDLNLVGKGDGGLEELAQEFNSGKIQYALSRVRIEEKNVEKIVFINWQGEGAPLVRKGMSANHIDTIRSFFKGVHLSLQARTDEDVDPDFIIQMVSKAVAGEGVKPSSSSSILDAEDTSTPVGAVYKKVNPKEEISLINQAKDDFWKKDQAEEERRRREEVNRQRKFSQDEVKLLRKESQEYFDKEEQKLAQEKLEVKRSSVSPRPPQQPKPAENGTGNGPSAGNTPTGTGNGPVPPITNGNERAAALQASRPTKNSDLVKQRIKSFDGGSGPVFPNKTPPPNKVNGMNSIIRSPSVETPATPPVNKMNGNGGIEENGGSGSAEEKLSVLKRRQLFEGGSCNGTGTPPLHNNQNTLTKRNPAEEIRLAQEQEKKRKEQEKLDREKVKIQPTDPEPEVVEVKVHVQEELPEEPKKSLSQTKIKFQEPEIQEKAQEIKEEEPANLQPVFFNNPTSTSPIKNKSPSPQPQPEVPQAEPEVEVELPKKSVNNHQHHETPHSPQPPIPNGDKVAPKPSSNNTITINITPAMGVCARALYDYQAADETEITFDPGDMISNIEKIDEGWWEGMGPDGQYGLFPANYVELLN